MTPDGGADPKVHRIPTPLSLAESQFREAMAEVSRDHTHQPQFGWRIAQEIVGPLLPGHLWTVGARPANGKTTFLLNAFDALVAAEWPCLYLTTETKAEEMRRQWAALRLGLPAAPILENAWGKLPANARARLEEELEWQAFQVADVALFVDLPRLDVDSVAKVLREYALPAAKGGAGYRFVFVDHIHRWQVREQSHKTAELTAAVQNLKGSATKYGLTLILAAQINRGQDRSPLAEFMPPPLSGLQQTSALEQESNAVLMLHRQRRHDATLAQAKEVAMGQRDVRDLLEPCVMCVSVAKHRNRPAAGGRTFRLQVHDSCALTELDSFGKARLGLPLGPEFTDEGTAQEPPDGVPF